MSDIERATDTADLLVKCWLCGADSCVEDTDLCGECWAVVEDQEA
jgi:hypothetical protein